MGREVVLVQWSTKEPGQREIKSRGEAIRFAMEELENSRRHNVQMVADGTVFGIVDIVRVYTGCEICIDLRFAPLLGPVPSRDLDQLSISLESRAVCMAKAIRDSTKSNPKMGRPKTTGPGEPQVVRMHDEQLEAIDDWIQAQERPFRQKRVALGKALVALSDEQLHQRGE